MTAARYQPRYEESRVAVSHRNSAWERSGWRFGPTDVPLARR